MPDREPLLSVLEDVTFAQLRTFACAARAGSFAAAADDLDISPPAVSAQVKILEERLGRTLFERRRGTTPVLTEEGEDALEIIESILAAGARLFGDGQKAAAKVTVRISAGPFLRENYLRPLLPRMYREHPDVAIDLQPTASTTEVLRQIELGDFHLAIYAIPAAEAVPPQTRQICELPMVMIAPPGTRARIASGGASLEELQYIFPGHKDELARWARNLFRELGFTPRRQPLFIEFVDVLAELVEDGQGVGHTLLTPAVAEKISAGLVEPLDIALAPMRRLIGRSPHAPAVARQIEEMLCEALTVRPGATADGKIRSASATKIL